MMLSLSNTSTHQQSPRQLYRSQPQHGQQQHISPFSSRGHQQSNGNHNQFKQFPIEQQQQHEVSHTDQLAIDCPDNIYLSSSDLEDLDSLSATVAADFMQSDNWNGLAHFTPRMNRFSHHRESSLSSLGSTGPASPFAPSTSNPQIAVTADSTNDMLSDAQTHDSAGTHGNSYYQLSAKAMGHYAPAYQNMDSTIPDLAYPLTIPGPNSKPRSDRGLLPAPEFGNGQNRSHPASVASSVAGDSPATPTIGDSDMADKRRRGKRPMSTTTADDDRLKLDSGYTGVPKLARTMTDVYGDELYNPNFTITSTSQTHPSITTSPTNDVFNQRIHAANNQHLSAAHSPVSSVSRDRSPFRTGSPLAPSPRHDFGSSNPSIQFNSAQRMREQTKAEQDARLFQQHMVRDVEPETPKTISPKDAILEFHESDAGDANFPLFPQESAQFDMDQLTKAMISQNSGASCAQPTSNAHNNGQLGFMPANVPQSLQIPQQYPFVARTGLNQNTPPRLSSAGSSTPGSGGSTPVAPMRPAGIAADGGTYTCTYHGCTQRFETPALLQKHKREGHRQQGTTIGAPRPHDSGMTSSLVNSQAGPHRCDRINPGTGKPCNTIFSRPYDLTRHEDTIHNARKQKVRCDLCTEEKTFSRADALTRHYRVCHPDMALPGKHRRRGGI